MQIQWSYLVHKALERSQQGQVACRAKQAVPYPFWFQVVPLLIKLSMTAMLRDITLVVSSLHTSDLQLKQSGMR